MAIGVDQIYLSMKSPDTGKYLTANVYTVDGVYEADGVTPRLLSIGQLVMALCLRRAAQLENGWDDPSSGNHVNGVVDLMARIEENSNNLELMTEIENAILEGSVDMSSKKVKYHGSDVTYHDFLETYMGMENVPTGTVNADSADLLAAIESKMDSLNSFSQQTMIELQSLTNKRDQAYDMISNVLKSLNTVLVANANNM
ncbi:MAG: hypothetical protein J6T51_02925 [Kiritimatiellae bacterium]|nr:hypothetical protein [Kiritimatiellia bacterium]